TSEPSPTGQTMARSPSARSEKLRRPCSQMIASTPLMCRFGPALRIMAVYVLVVVSWDRIWSSLIGVVIASLASVRLAGRPGWQGGRYRTARPTLAISPGRLGTRGYRSSEVVHQRLPRQGRGAITLAGSAFARGSGRRQHALGACVVARLI